MVASMMDDITLKIAGVLDTGMSPEEATALLEIIEGIKQDERKKTLAEVIKRVVKVQPNYLTTRSEDWNAGAAQAYEIAKFELREVQNGR